MALAPGTRVGSYEVIAPLGAGGMGEVYRARDTKLDREVALKVLPADVATDPERLGRFEREAKAVASLSHPHILAIHDFGTRDGTAFAVMELLEGSTLRDRLADGPLPARKTIELAQQVASGLAAAHDKGIAHRDLKPENLFVTRDGHVKILDFGLAKLQGGPGRELTVVPTAAPETAPGVVLGTVGYMAPEQVRGEAADHRADIFAFGAILYEMVAGARAFTGRSAVETMHAILRDDPPDVPATGVAVPPVLDRIVRRCLEKEPAERFQSARDLGFALQAVSGAMSPAGSGAGAAPALRRVSRWRAYAIGGVGGAALSAVAAALLAARPGATVVAPRVVRFAIDIPASRVLESFALSPDGSRLAYIAAEGAKTRVYVRPLDRADDAALAGTEGAKFLFFSPDSQWLAFFSDNRLRRVPVGGGDAVSIVEVADAAVFEVGASSGTWASDGSIVFAGSSRGLLRVAASGGEPTVVAAPADDVRGGGQYYFPHVVTARNAVLITMSTAGAFDDARIEQVPLAGGARTTVVRRGTGPTLLPTGHLLFGDGSRLVAAPFDPSGSAAAGAGVTVVDRLAYGNKQPLYSASAAGDLAVAIAPEPPVPELLRVDRAGRVEHLEGAVSGMAQSLSLSPDGSRLAGYRTTRDRKMAVVVIDLTRGVATQLPGESQNHVPAWLPDGRTLAFSSDRDGAFNVYLQAADGTGAVERLTNSTRHEDLGSWSRDGRWLAYAVAGQRTKTDLWVLDRTTNQSRPFRQTPAEEKYPSVSPDGAWLAYQSDESGKNEVYAEAFPGGGSRVQLSTAGGTEPLWSPAGGEIFYRLGKQFLSVSVRPNAGLGVGRPAVLFESDADALGAFGMHSYAVAPDGRHFYVVRGSGAGTAKGLNRIEVVLNWIEEFKRRVAK